MSRIIIYLSFFLSLYTEVSKAQSTPTKIKIAFLADVHFQDIYGTLQDSDYKGITNPKNGKHTLLRTMESQLHSTRIFNENYFAFLAALDDIVQRGIKIVALPGDYSDDGQPLHIRGLRQILTDYTKKYGIQFFITTGNHDPAGPFAQESGKNDFLGIGRKHTKRLQAKNIFNAYQFTQLSDEWVRKEMAVVGLRLKHELEGKPTLDLESPKNKKMIATTRSFEKMYTKIEELSERVSTFSACCSEKLRKQGSHCNMIMVFVQTNYFRKDQPQYSRNIIINTDFPTNSTIELNQYAQIGLKALFREGYSYKKAGVIVMGLTPNNETQLSLFNTSNPKHQLLMSVIDKMNKSYGTNKIKFATQSLDRQWKMKQEKLSPSFTTKIKEIISIKL